MITPTIVLAAAMGLGLAAWVSFLMSNRVAQGGRPLLLGLITLVAAQLTSVVLLVLVSPSWVQWLAPAATFAVVTLSVLQEARRGNRP